jgi:hypothetical protein
MILQSASSIPQSCVLVAILVLSKVRNLPRVLARLPSDAREVVVDEHSVDDTITGVHQRDQTCAS